MAQCGWLSGTAPCASASVAPKFQQLIVGQQGAGDDAGRAAPLRFTTMRERRAHHAVRRFVEDAPARLGDLRHVGARRPSPERASARPDRRHRARCRARRTAGRSPRAAPPPARPTDRRLATLTRNPFAASHFSPSRVGAQLSPAALQLVHRRAVMVERDADGQPVAVAVAQRAARRASCDASASSRWSAPCASKPRASASSSIAGSSRVHERLAAGKADQPGAEPAAPRSHRDSGHLGGGRDRPAGRSAATI